MRWSHRSSRGSRSRPPRNPQPPTPPYKLDSPLPYAPYKLDAPLPYAPYKTDTLPPAVLPSVPRTVASRTRFCCAAATKRGAPFIHSSSSFNLSDAVHQRLRRPGNRRRRRLNRPGDPGAGTTPPALRTNRTRLSPRPAPTGRVSSPPPVQTGRESPPSLPFPPPPPLLQPQPAPPRGMRSGPASGRTTPAARVAQLRGLSRDRAHKNTKHEAGPRVF